MVTMYISILCTAIFCLSQLQCSNAVMGTTFWKIREQVEEYRRNQIIDQYPYLTNSPNVTTDFIEQPLDHFDPISKEMGKTFHQRFYVNTQYWKKPDGPVFLYIQGEGTDTSYSVQRGEHVELAEKYGALLVSAEHRFYGASINDDGLKLGNLRSLSSQQALADLAEVRRHIDMKYSLSAKNTWICFGGSYAGALTAWFRIKYPHLVYGAIASSAPVHAITNFQGYNAVVGRSLSDPVVGGSSFCMHSVQNAFAKVDDLIKQKQLTKLASDFFSCGDISDPNDTILFVSNLAGNFEGMVQYNRQGLPLDIGHVCKAMARSSDLYINLIKVNQLFLKASGAPCVDNSYKNYTEMMANTTVDKGVVGVGIRQWVYQTCTQFGYYQTCDKGTGCPFSYRVDLSHSDVMICQSIFGISSVAHIKENVAFSNDYYGSDHPKGSRIVFVNGSIDPWHALSVLQNQSGTTETAVFINGTSHCENMATSSPNDSPALKEARQKISNQIGMWLTQASVLNTRTN
jgi:serine protease 16